MCVCMYACMFIDISVEQIAFSVFLCILVPPFFFLFFFFYLQCIFTYRKIIFQVAILKTDYYPLTFADVVIPACGDLVSLSIDIWMTGEEMDGERLVVASDIGMRPLILADLQPPPLCRYLKVSCGLMVLRCYPLCMLCEHI